MSLPIRWLHLSDFHAGKDGYAERKMYDYIISHVKQRKDEGFEPDLLFITGDLANKGLKSEYEDLWLECLFPLQEIIGNNIGERTFIVPGNHDADREHNQAFGREEMLSESGHYFDPTQKGLKARQMLIPRFQAFNDCDNSSVGGAFVSRDGAYSVVLTIRDTKVGIAGINTAWLCRDAKDERKLTPGKAMVEKALGSISESQLRIVLGHHPVDWFLPAEQKPIKSLFGKNSVIYLHGHLHEEWAEPAYGGGHQFLAIQSGAAFQAREREFWRNGVVWGQADIESDEILLQARRWIPDQQAWVPVTEAFHETYRNGDWWHYPLPGGKLAKKLARNLVVAAAAPATGWTISTPDELLAHLRPLEDEVAIRFFNGASPSWASVLSSSIPRRKIVTSLVSSFREVDLAARPFVTVLLAAGCEGKTTALLQSAYQIVREKSDWRILRRDDNAESLNTKDILALLNKESHWLVVIDEADEVSKTLIEFLRQLPLELKGRVHFMLACRDSDWLGAGAHKLEWQEVCHFHGVRLSGLDAQDAAAIVAAWGNFGDAGLGELATVAEDERVAILSRQAREEAKTNQGAFFGALLAVRHGRDLPNHARLMLERLSQRKIPGGLTLRHAMAYIAAMHSEGLEFLSRSVLAECLGCPAERLHKEVLVPLGEEAAATSASAFIYTRHRTVARAVIDVLERDLALDCRALFVELALAAAVVAQRGLFVAPNLGVWRQTFPDHFVDSERTDLAIEIGEMVFSRIPVVGNLMSLARLYRQCGHGFKASSLFLEYESNNQIFDRKVWKEWGYAEHVNNDPVAATCLAAISISDDCSSRRVDASIAVLSLLKISQGFHDLYNLYRDSIFSDARSATAWMGLHLVRDQALRDEFERLFNFDGLNFDADNSIDMFYKGLVEAKECGFKENYNNVRYLHDDNDFTGLEKLLKSSNKISGEDVK